ncbi:MAG TPA: alpha-E domain-containing protein [Candidatus Saccharimonadales bacterium]|nr:alpha-E domain-containing protein [Candidatus Saccharimonadales bacterium]
MLSRVANSLYWMSRYIERGENIARIVDVNLQLLLDLRNLNEERLAQHWLPIVQTTGDEAQFFQLHKKATGQAVTEFLVFQIENPNSLVSSICQARENARMIRDQITIEFWEELNRLYWFVKTPEARRIWRESPSDFFQEIKNSSLHLIGLSYSTLIRNEGWWFLQVGKFLERADKTSRILDVRSGVFPEKGAPPAVGQFEALEWSAILRSCSAWDAYKSLHGVEVNPRGVVEFLLLNDDFPRSVRFCVGQFNHALRRISGVAEGRFCNNAEKLAGRLVAELQFSTLDEIFAQGLHLYLDQLQSKLNNIGAALFDAYIFQQFNNLEDEIMVQQEEQQQQFGTTDKTKL